jgi:hypothetical protein
MPLDQQIEQILWGGHSTLEVVSGFALLGVCALGLAVVATRTAAEARRLGEGLVETRHAPLDAIATTAG